MNKKLFLVILTFNFSLFTASAQDQNLVDSLETQLKNHNTKKTELQIKSPSLYDTTAANILYELSRSYWFINLDKAQEYTKQCMAISEQIGFKEGIGNAYISMGLINKMRGDYLPALDFNKKALKIGLEIRYKKCIASSYSSNGAIYYDLGNYPESLKNFFTCLKIFEETGNKIGTAGIYSNIGLVYVKLGNYPKALKNHIASLKVFEEIGNKLGISTTYINIGNIHYEQHNNPEALKNYFASLKINQEIGNQLGIATAYDNIGLVYTDQGNYPEALKNHFAALKINEEIGNINGIAGTYTHIGRAKIKTFPAREGKDWLLKGLQLAKEIEALPLIKESYEGLYESDSAHGNFKGAFENHKSFMLFSDSIENTENTRKTVALQMNYDFSKKQDSLNVVQAKKDLVAQKELDKQILVRNGFISGTIILLLLAGAAILFFIDRFKRNRKKQMEAVRARISRDLHDDMGSTLQSISVMSEIARMKSKSDNMQESMPFIEKIGIASREMIDKMSDIVWAVSPQNDNFENIILHMRAFGGELLAGKDIALHFKSDSGLNSIMLPMEKRKSFFLVYKEALNNAYKYSGAKNVKVEISKTNHSLMLIVEDDGVGFNRNEDRLKTGGNGLKNMNTRAAELNGSISIASEPGHGTKVMLMVNLS